MKGQIEDKHNTLIYFKSNLRKKVVSNSYNLWQFCMISILYWSGINLINHTL